MRDMTSSETKAMAEAPVRSEISDGVAVITLNRPDKLNAFNEEMHLALRAALDRVEADEETEMSS